MALGSLTGNPQGHASPLPVHINMNFSETNQGAYRIGSLCRLSICHCQTSSFLKLLSQSKPNFLWRLLANYTYDCHWSFNMAATVINLPLHHAYIMPKNAAWHKKNPDVDVLDALIIQSNSTGFYQIIQHIYTASQILAQIFSHFCEVVKHNQVGYLETISQSWTALHIWIGYSHNMASNRKRKTTVDQRQKTLFGCSDGIINIRTNEITQTDKQQDTTTDINNNKLVNISFTKEYKQCGVLYCFNIVYFLWSNTICVKLNPVQATEIFNHAICISYSVFNHVVWSKLL